MTAIRKLEAAMAEYTVPQTSSHPDGYAKRMIEIGLEERGQGVRDVVATFRSAASVVPISQPVFDEVAAMYHDEEPLDLPGRDPYQIAVIRGHERCRQEGIEIALQAAAEIFELDYQLFKQAA